jgi:hypothetical protein
MAAAGALSLGGQQLRSRRRLLLDYLSSEGCDLASCEVSLSHFKSLARRLRWLEPQAAWSIGEADGVQMLSLPVKRDDESLLWLVSWRPDGSDWLTSEELALDMQELHPYDGVVIVWPEGIKEEHAEAAGAHEAQLEARMTRPIKQVIIIECVCGV